MPRPRALADLKSIDKLEEYVASSAVIMIFVSKGYVRIAHAPHACGGGCSACVAANRRPLAAAFGTTLAPPCLPRQFLSANCLREARCATALQKPLALVHDAATYLASFMPLATIRDDECPDALRASIFGGRDVISFHRLKDFQLVSLKWRSLPDELAVASLGVGMRATAFWLRRTVGTPSSTV